MDRRAPGLSELGAAVAALLVERKETVAVAESSAGGLISAALVAVPGASAYYLGGTVVYTPKARAALMSIAKEDMNNGMRASTEAYALLVARRMRGRMGATWALSETGATGPTGNRYGDAPGHACLAVSGPIEKAVTLETGSAEREANMWAFARRALELLEESIREAIRSACSRP